MIVSRFRHPVVGAISVLAVAVMTAWVWLEILSVAGNWARTQFPFGYHLMTVHLAGTAFLLPVAMACHRWISPIGIGRIRQRASILPAVAVFAVYAMEYGYGKLTGLPPEIWVVELLNQPLWPLLSVFLTILLLAPLGEEILFRGILLNVFRTERAWTYWSGVVIVSLIFGAVHSQYQNLSTIIEMVALSVIFAWARLRSGGLALPVLLHTFAAVLAVIITWYG